MKNRVIDIQKPKMLIVSWSERGHFESVLESIPAIKLDLIRVTANGIASLLSGVRTSVTEIMHHVISG